MVPLFEDSSSGGVQFSMKFNFEETPIRESILNLKNCTNCSRSPNISDIYIYMIFCYLELKFI